jgi:hypothetical protein
MSNINFENINEDFPVLGEDNDTQVFRDNFDSIKQNFRIAQEEIADLQENTPRTDIDSNFNNNIVQNAVFRNSPDAKLDGGNITVNVLTIDYQNGNYQIFSFNQNTVINFINFPNDSSITPAIGKITLEMYSSDGAPKTITFGTTQGNVLKKSSNFPSTVVVDSLENNATNAGNPIIIEVWGHRSDRLFLNYLGKFSS